MHGRRIYHARGKVLGGSSSINGMIFQRGNPLDYERWAADPGMESWDYAHCLPYFKRMETCTAGADEWRGGDGPIVLERGPAANPLFGAFLQAVQQAGYSLTDDVNGARQEGFATFDRTIRSRPADQCRRRVSPARPEPPEPARRDPPLRHADRLRGDEGGRRRGGRPGRRPRERGHPLRRRDQLAPAAAALRDRQRSGARGARRRRRPRPARRRREPPGPPRGLRPARLEAARLARTVLQVAEPAARRRCAGSCSRTARARRTTSRRAASSARTTTSPTRT